MSNEKEIWLRPSIVDGVLRITDQHGNPCRGLSSFSMNVNDGGQLTVSLTANVYEESESLGFIAVNSYDYEIQSYETK